MEDPDNVDPDDVFPDELEFIEDTLSLRDLLGLPQSAMKEIRRSYQSNTKRKEAYLDTYAHHHPCPSWKKISVVLNRCRLGQQAHEVDNTYVQGMHAHYRSVHSRGGYISAEQGGELSFYANYGS